MNWPLGSWVFRQCLWVWLHLAIFVLPCLPAQFVHRGRKGWRTDLLVYLSCHCIALIKHPGKSGLRRKDSGSRLRFSAVHSAGDILVAGACGSWSYYIHGQEAENHEFWVSTSSPLYVVHSAFMVGLYTSINGIKFSGECFLEDSRYIKLTVLPILLSPPQCWLPLLRSHEILRKVLCIRD